TVARAVPRPKSESPASPASIVTQPGSVLRSETVAVVVDVIVTDPKGPHVPGLSAGVFWLYEDKEPQTIAEFTPPASPAKRRQTKATRTLTAASTSARPATEERDHT